MIKRILVGVAGTPAAEAKIRYALELAERHGAMVSALSVVDVQALQSQVGMVGIGGGHYAGRIVDARARDCFERAAAVIDRFETEARAAGVPFEAHREEGDPFDHLARRWRTSDLCILGCRGWFDHGVVPEPKAVLLKLIKQGVRPILAVHEEFFAVRKVLVAYNGSLESAKAMKRFCQLRLWPDAALHLAHFGPAREPVEALLKDAAEYVAAHGYPVTTAVRAEDPIAGIRAEAERIGADLKVMGSSHRTALFGDRFGKTALHHLQNAQRPVFLTH